jgi:hypothetical protein
VSSILGQIQKELADKALADPFFSDIPVLTEQMKDIAYLCELAVQKTRRAVVVTTPRADISYPDRLTPYFDDIRVIGFCFENVSVNKNLPGYVSSLEIAEQLTATWYQYRPEGINEVWVPERPTISLGSDLDHPLVQLVSDSFFLAYAVRFKTSGGLFKEVPKVATPVWNATAKTLTCATAGAATFYTITGGYPNPQTNLYSGPLTLAMGTVLLARSYLAGYLSSELLKVTV